MLKKRNFRRESNCRQAKNVYVIATEGEKTEPQYFNGLKNHYRNPRIYVKVLDRSTSASSPKHIIRTINKIRKDFDFKRDDEMWIVIDKDRWSARMLSQVATQCNQKNINMALSNPCFEVWLLLHLKDMSEYSDSKITILQNNKNRDLEKEIRRICGKFNKINLDLSKYIPNISAAIDRAHALDTNPGHRWPNSIGTRVYKIAEKIISF
jgi:hypothetical protein